MRRLTVVLSGFAVVVLILAVAQVALPGIAADHIRDQLKKNGKVLEVDVSAFPAIELLWHQADSVTVKMASYRSPSPSDLSNLLDESRDTGTLHASATVLTDGLLTLHNATLTKSGTTLTGTAEVHEADIQAAFGGFVQSVTPQVSSRNQLVLQVTGGIGPFSGTIDGVVAAQGGKLVAGIPILGDLTLFSDRNISVDRVGASSASGGFVVSVRGHLG
jgi:hypothetical protein